MYRPCCKIIYIETMDDGKVTRTYVAEILQNKISCSKFIYLKSYINEAILKSFLVHYITHYINIHNLDEGLALQ